MPLPNPMTIHSVPSRQPSRAPRAVRRATSILVCGVLLHGVAHASALGDGVRSLGTGANLSRTIALADLGITAPVVLSGDASQDFYLPVPKGLPLADASIAFDGRYLKGEKGPASVVLSIDGQPLTSQSVPDGDGPLQRSLAVPSRPRDTGFVRLGVNWHSRTGTYRCEPDHSLANSVSISPQTRLTYRIDQRSVTSLDDAWSTLPGSPVLLVASKTLTKEAFDSAWRIGVALERSGKRVVVRALPAVGDTVDTRDVVLPAALAGVPAFAAIKDNNAAHKLANDAELGALLAIGAPAVSGEIAVADGAMRTRLAAAFDALQGQLANDSDAADAFKTWRAQRAPLSGQALGAKQIRLLSMGSQSVIAIAGDAGAQAAGLFDDSLRRVLLSSNVTAPIAHTPDIEDKQVVRLSSLGGSADSFDVLARGDWTVSFPLSAVASGGRMPGEISLYLSAAPGPATSKPVATVFWNGILLAAKQLDANGRPEQLKARVPGYALGVNNNLRVSVQRQPYSADCNEIPQAYPVNVLPAASYVRPGKAEPDGTFVGLLPLMAGNPELIVPDRYLQSAPENIRRVIGIAAASGLSPSRAELTVAAGEKSVKPSKPFVAMEVQVDGAKPSAVVTDRQRLEIGGKDAKWLDITGLQRLSTAEVVRGGGHDGLLWYAIGEPKADVGAPFLLNRGNLAIIGPAGPVAWIDTSNPDASLPPGAGESAFYEWRRYVSWGVPAIAIALLVFLTLLVLALRAGRKNKSNGH
ncbi:hypothetical protein PHO31112_02960 [Pandoraea horticolens]|uniref:Cellulose synthase regulatory subunit n=1 Tax=Pandoraea horticolens TaxID=2508298 RepID=A0A5E4VZ88_9BURK|nr:cellulose biosynthesis cyclic di-GMP-binding regulatory protein BcsB [Pandoraea horticolens]VVE17682.1 hypothetical protein PHO31112_02960 [Pandoraea horticolens]